MLLVPERIRHYAATVAERIEQGRLDEAARLSTHLSYGRIAAILAGAERAAVLPFLRALGAERAALAVAELPLEFAAGLLEEVEPAEAARWLAQMPADVTADLIAEIDDDHAARLLALLPATDRVRVEALVGHEEDTAGALMSPYFLAVPDWSTVAGVIAAVRGAQVPRTPTAYIYVVDAVGKLVGVVSLRDVLLAPPSTPIERIMRRQVLAARVDDEAREVAERVRSRRLKMLPIVNGDDVLVGVVSVEDAMELLSYELAEDIAGIGASSPDESFFTPPAEAIRMRLPWMSANVFLNLGAVAVIASFEDTIAQVAILAAFLPMITDMGGNVGIQALSVSIRSIALGEVRIRDHWRAVRKELIIGVVNGLALGALFAAIAWLLEGNVVIGLVAGAALAVNVLVAGVVGGTIPFLIKRLGRDPAMMTGPILTTITDITGVTIYLGLSTIFVLHMMGG